MANIKNTVIVALNHPSGIIFNLKGKKVTIKGNAEHLRGVEMGKIPKGAYGLTEIPADEWEEIKRLYGGMEIFKSGLIFAQTSTAKAQAEAEEKKETRHGREPAAQKQIKTTPFEGE